MATANTFYAAAQKTAQIAGLPWTRVQPIYRALQNHGGKMNTPWLPKSAGRAVWMAHPNFISRLLIALATAASADQAHEMVEWAVSTTPGGRQRYMTELDAAGVVPLIERELHPYLVSPERALDLINVEFRHDRNEIVFLTKSQGEIIYSKPYKSGEGRGDDPKPFQGIYSRGIIDGKVFVMIAHSIIWLRPDEAPFNFSAPEDPAE